MVESFQILRLFDAIQTSIQKFLVSKMNGKHHIAPNHNNHEWTEMKMK